MKNSHHFLVSWLAVGLLAVLIGLSTLSGSQTTAMLENVSHTAAPLTQAEMDVSQPVLAVAERLGQRLTETGQVSPSIAVLAKAVENREQLLTHTVMFRVSADTMSAATVLDLQKYPEWVGFTASAWSADFRVDAQAVRQSLEQNEIPGVTLKQDVTLLSSETDKNKVIRVKTDVIGKAGFDFDSAAVAKQIADAFNAGQDEVDVQASVAEPTVTMTDADGKTVTFDILSSGFSDFSDSTPGRLHNVHKVIEERVNNILIPNGTTFSLIAALDAPITVAKGWMEDLGLFGGSAALTPGAGICQSATTLYRAALLAGLPITEKDNHSLFVSHYEYFGIGLDATVFPVQPRIQDLKFKNDTGAPIVVQAYTVGDKVVINFFGKSDGRSVDMIGPFFNNATAARRPAVLRGLGRNEIGWVRELTLADGRKLEQPIIATYAKPVWNSIAKKYNQTAEGMALLVKKGN